MDAAIAGLLGTLVGGAISGSVAFGTDGLRARRERSARWLTERRAVYLRMIRLTRDQMLVYSSLSAEIPEETERLRAEQRRIDIEIADLAEDLLPLGSAEVVKALEDQQNVANGTAATNDRDREIFQSWLRLRDIAREDLLT